MALDHVGSSSPSLNCLHGLKLYLNELVVDCLYMNTCIAYRVCLCYYVLGFAAHSIISSTDSDVEDCYEDDRYENLG